MFSTKNSKNGRVVEGEELFQRSVLGNHLTCLHPFLGDLPSVRWLLLPVAILLSLLLTCCSVVLDSDLERHKELKAIQAKQHFLPAYLPTTQR
jgi:hypothetical protein